jgi:hypothetical protein
MSEPAPLGYAIDRSLTRRVRTVNDFLKRGSVWQNLPLSDQESQGSRKSSIFLRRIVSSMFMRVNCKCAHQVRPPLAGQDGDSESSARDPKIGWPGEMGSIHAGSARAYADRVASLIKLR